VTDAAFYTNVRFRGLANKPAKIKLGFTKSFVAEELSMTFANKRRV